MSTQQTLNAIVPNTLAGVRLDLALAKLFPDYSRARIQRWIEQGDALVDDRARRNRDRVAGGERITLRVRLDPAPDWQPESRPLEVVYEDEDIIVIDKEAGLVVHPGAGNPAGTLLNALIAHEPALAEVPRAGIVHRLDKDTSGLMVVARTVSAHHRLVGELKARRVVRQYETIVAGRVARDGSVNAPIGRHSSVRTRMAVRDGGKAAITHYRVQARFAAHSHLRVTLETGRTHQIRVHLAHIGHPLVGDPLYGRRRRSAVSAASDALEIAIAEFPRQALHAVRLELSHPASGARMAWTSELPSDMAGLLALLAAPSG